MQEYKYLKIEKKGKICVLRLNNPAKKNALSDSLRTEIMDALDLLKDDNRIATVIFYGGEEYFSTGFDKDEVQASLGNPEKMKYLRDATILFQKKIWEYPKLLIAAINGYALGGGFDLAVISHLRIAGNNAIFGHPEIRFGAPPLFFSYMTLVGRGKALELVLNTATRDTFITAEEAHRLNIVNKIVEPENVLKEAITMAKQINKSPGLTVQIMLKINNIFFDQVKAFESEIETIVDKIKM
jgi:enoyl-CoA hydratase